MRLSVASLRRMIKGKLPTEFVHQELTSYSGLELLRRYLRQLNLPNRLHAACAATGGDYGKQIAAERQRWLPVAPNVTGFFHDLHIPQW
ncbi:MAG: hypothetical protein ACREMY_09135, partial [bacterium]